MPLVPETKMVDACKQPVSGTHWPGEPCGQCSKLCLPFQFRPAFLEPTPWQNFSINTLIFRHSLFFTFPLTGPTHSFQCDFQREYYHSLISTNNSIPPQKCICHANILLLVTPFQWDFFSFKNNRNFVKPPKERKKQYGRRHVPPNIHY